MNTTHNFPTFMPATAISPFVKFTRAPHTYVCYVGRSQTWPKGRILRGGRGGGSGEDLQNQEVDVDQKTKIHF
jgi:hypothetical protein